MNRFLNYDDIYCWQYKVKLSTLNDDLNRFNINSEDIKIKDLLFCYINKEDKDGCSDIRRFIERYEWLGKLPVWVTHRFAAYYKNIMVAAIVMSTPNSFSGLLGDEFKHREKLISRGATISFAPKNVASWIIMKSIKWMSKNTDFVIFTSYADPSARELGTVYQACNFYYLGNSFGGAVSYINKSSGNSYSGSYFANRSVIKRAALDYGVDWKPEYIKSNKSGNKRIINWDAMNDDIKLKVKDAINQFKVRYFDIVKSPPKHKYVYILGNNSNETKKLRQIFEERNNTFSYPKQRGL